MFKSFDFEVTNMEDVQELLKCYSDEKSIPFSNCTKLRETSINKIIEEYTKLIYNQDMIKESIARCCHIL